MSRTYWIILIVIILFLLIGSVYYSVVSIKSKRSVLNRAMTFVPTTNAPITTSTPLMAPMTTSVPVTTMYPMTTPMPTTMMPTTMNPSS